MRKQLFSIIIISLVIVGLLVFYLQYKERIMPDKISVFCDNNITIVSKELNKEAISMAFNELNSSVSDADPIINTTYKSIEDIWQQSGFEFFYINRDHTISINTENMTGNYFIILFEDTGNCLLLLKNKNDEIDNKGFIIHNSQGLRKLYEELRYSVQSGDIIKGK